MDTPLTLDEVRDAVGDLSGALLHHRPLTDDQWDRAITTLLTAREQHGGRIRHLIHIILGAGGTPPPSALPDALSELHCHLAVADNPPPRPRRSRRRRHPLNPPNPHTQLELFNTIDHPPPANAREFSDDQR